MRSKHLTKKVSEKLFTIFCVKKESGIRENLTPIAARLGNKRENPSVVLL